MTFIKWFHIHIVNEPTNFKTKITDLVVHQALNSMDKNKYVTGGDLICIVWNWLILTTLAGLISLTSWLGLGLVG